MMRVFIMAMLFGEAACSAPPRIASAPPRPNAVVVGAATVENCRYMGILYSKLGGNFRSFEENLHNCQRDIIFQATALGATHVVMGEMERLERTYQPWDFASDEGCNNCVSVQAKAYFCSNEALDGYTQGKSQISEVDVDSETNGESLNEPTVEDKCPLVKDGVWIDPSDCSVGDTDTTDNESGGTSDSEVKVDTSGQPDIGQPSTVDNAKGCTVYISNIPKPVQFKI